MNNFPSIFFLLPKIVFGFFFLSFKNTFVDIFLCFYLCVAFFSVRILEFSFVVVVYFDHFKMGKKLFFCFVYLFKNWNFFPLLFFESNKTMMMAVDDKHTLIPSVEIFWRRKICVLDWLIDWLILRFFFQKSKYDLHRSS